MFNKFVVTSTDPWNNLFRPRHPLIRFGCCAIVFAIVFSLASFVAALVGGSNG